MRYSFVDGGRAALARALMLVSLCGLSSCQEASIAHDINQRQANEIIAVLSEQGISARAVRGTGSRAQFQIEVPVSRYSEAVTILHYEGLPKVEEPSVNELLSPKGFLPNSRELERLRIDRAVAAEIETLLKANPSVIEARAIVRRPIFEGVGPEPPTHVSLVVKKTPGGNLDRGVVTGLVGNLVPGVTADSIVLDVQDAGPVTGTDRIGALRTSDGGKVVKIPLREFLGFWRVADDDYDRMVWSLFALIVGFLGIGLFVGFSAGFIGKKVVSSKGLDTTPSLKTDRPTLSLNSPESQDR